MIETVKDDVLYDLTGSCESRTVHDGRTCRQGRARHPYCLHCQAAEIIEAQSAELTRLRTRCAALEWAMNLAIVDIRQISGDQAIQTLRAALRPPREEEAP